MSRCYYQLKIGNIWLAPRGAISVEERDDFEQLTTKGGDSGGGDCAGCGGNESISKREVCFKVKYRGRGSLATAWAMATRVNDVLDSGCDREDMKQVGFERRVCDEPWLRYNIRSGTQRMVDTWTQRTCDRILVMELCLNLVEYNPDNLINFGSGPFSTSFA